MNQSEKKLVFSQFIKLVIDSRNIINLLSQGFESKHKKKILDLLISIDKTLDQYYMNFDICDNCGHPAPTIPSNSEHQTLDDFFNSYIDLYELKTGEEFDESVFGNYELEDTPITPTSDSSKLQVSDDLKKLNKRAKKYTHIKGTLIKVS